MKAPTIVLKLTTLVSLLCAPQLVLGSLDITPSTLVQAIRTKYCIPTPTPTPEPVIPAVLSITKTGPSGTQPRAANFNYVIVVTNTSTVAANNVIVTDTLPTSDGGVFVTFNPVLSSTTQGTLSVSGNIVTATVGTLAPGASVTITLNVSVFNSNNFMSGIINTAVATSSNADSVQDFASTSIQGGGG